MVLVEIRAGGMTGLGYTYADIGTAAFVRNILVELVTGHDPMNIPSLWAEMFRQVRNLGQTGIAAMGISPVDNALWDLKAKLLEVSLVTLLGEVRAEAPIYGSGGFTSYSDKQLERQFGDCGATAPELEGRGGLVLEDCAEALPVRPDTHPWSGYDASVADAETAHALWLRSLDILRALGHGVENEG